MSNRVLASFCNEQIVLPWDDKERKINREMTYDYVLYFSSLNAVP